MTTEYLEADSWEDLVLLINDMFIAYPAYIFRGHSQDDWKIESSLTRLLRDSELTRDFEVFYNDHLQNFKFKARGQGFDLKNMTDDEVWAVGQHYGLATPLVDWTHSPFVAVFFALVGKLKSDTGKKALWAFNFPDWENFYKKYKKLVTPVQPLDNNRRLFNQNGLFLKLPINDDFESIVNKQPDQEWVSLHKITFPDNITDQAIIALNLMNINYSSLYPDMPGACMACNQYLRNYNYISDLQTKNLMEKE